MTTQPRIPFNDGLSIPQIGLGVWRAKPNDAATAVTAALRAGYRHVDTAAIYDNEEGVGRGLKEGGVPREEVFVTTKLWNADQGYDTAMAAAEASLKRLGLDHVDLYLIHWPAPKKGLFVESWKALVQLQKEGRARSIGVSNFQPEHLDRIIDATGVVPALNQVELHPRFQQRALRQAHEARGIVTQCWSPLGQGQVLADPVVGRIAARHGRTPAQVVIRWHLENGLVAIPKSITPSRIIENADVFGFSLDAQDMAEMAKLNSPDGRIGPNPLTADF